MSVIRYDVPMVRQERSPVCWLACATMIMQFKRGYTPRGATVELSGNDFRTSSTRPSWRGNKLMYRRMRDLGFTVEGSREVHGRVFDRGTPRKIGAELIARMLSGYGPFALFHHCGMFWYGSGVALPNRGAHAVVITGIDTDRGRVFFNNPWGRRNIPTTLSSIAAAIGRWETTGPSFAYLPS